MFFVLIDIPDMMEKVLQSYGIFKTRIMYSIYTCTNWYELEKCDSFIHVHGEWLIHIGYEVVIIECEYACVFSTWVFDMFWDITGLFCCCSHYALGIHRECSCQTAHQRRTQKVSQHKQAWLQVEPLKIQYTILLCEILKQHHWKFEIFTICQFRFSQPACCFIFPAYYTTASVSKPLHFKVWWMWSAIQTLSVTTAAVIEGYLLICTQIMYSVR